jgi:hypothetical protein
MDIYERQLSVSVKLCVILFSKEGKVSRKRDCRNSKQVGHYREMEDGYKEKTARLHTRKERPAGLLYLIYSSHFKLEILVS